MGMLVREDDIVRALVPDPARLPDVILLVGFLGESLREGRRRLYLTPEFSDYVEFHSDDLAHSKTLDGEADPLSVTAVWLRREANLLRTRSSSREAQADFLQGGITAGYLTGSGGSALMPTAITIAPWFRAAGCLTGGDLDTFCAACTAVPTALVLRNIQRALSLGRRSAVRNRRG